MDLEVRENEAEDRFELLVDGQMAGLAAYRVRDGRTVITHSQVDPAYRGKGLGGELARLTLDHLRAKGVPVTVTCPFFVKYVEEHHDWDDILEEG
jgi:predicted GNAT family acetyltransferase